MKQSPKQPAEKRRAQLIKAAHKVFAKKGYAGATTAEIAKAANLTKGALYFHFKNKEDIFFAVIKDLFEEASTPFYQIMNQDLMLDEFIDKSVQTSFDLLEGRKYMSIDFWQRANKIPKIRGYLVEENRKLENSIAAYLSSKSRLKKKDCEAFIRLLHAMMDGVMVRNTICTEKNDINSLSRLIKEIAKLYVRKDMIKLGQL